MTPTKQWLFEEMAPEPKTPNCTWQEVPQARFLSWPLAMQLTYCAARDEDAARTTLDASEVPFYLERAKGYRKRK